MIGLETFRREKCGLYERGGFRTSLKCADFPNAAFFGASFCTPRVHALAVT
jgi:hypothetical protein